MISWNSVSSIDGINGPSSNSTNLHSVYAFNWNIFIHNNVEYFNCYWSRFGFTFIASEITWWKPTVSCNGVMQWSCCYDICLEKSNVASLSFADDLVILSNTSEGLQNSLNKLEKYCFDWQLTVNTKKRKVMIFQNTQSPSPNFYYKNVLLTETKEYNFLGNVIDFKGISKRLHTSWARKN